MTALAESSSERLEVPPRAMEPPPPAPGSPATEESIAAAVPQANLLSTGQKQEVSEICRSMLEAEQLVHNGDCRVVLILPFFLDGVCESPAGTPQWFARIKSCHYNSQSRTDGTKDQGACWSLHLLVT
jgi:hypothetical protein